MTRRKRLEASLSIIESRRPWASTAVVALLLLSVAGFAVGTHASPVAAPHDGPFGIAMGEPLSELGPVRLAAPGRYEVLRPRRPNSMLVRVYVDLYPSTGVCEIDGNSAGVIGDERGVQLRRVLDEIAETLKSKYGPYRKDDTCSTSAEECVEFWTEKLNEGVQKYDYDWNFGTSARPDNTNEINLSAQATSSIKSYAVLSYFSANQAACDAAAKAAQASSL
jgi:hypothetical protein